RSLTSVYVNIDESRRNVTVGFNYWTCVRDRPLLADGSNFPFLYNKKGSPEDGFRTNRISVKAKVAGHMPEYKWRKNGIAARQYLR
ncbi:MAG TPA: hypothetical protein VGE93_02275, partial [Bryobacteraceae bacterium]